VVSLDRTDPAQRNKRKGGELPNQPPAKVPTRAQKPMSNVIEDAPLKLQAKYVYVALRGGVNILHKFDTREEAIDLHGKVTHVEIEVSRRSSGGSFTLEPNTSIVVSHAPSDMSEQVIILRLQLKVPTTCRTKPRVVEHIEQTRQEYNRVLKVLAVMYDYKCGLSLDYLLTFPGAVHLKDKELQKLLNEPTWKREKPVSSSHPPVTYIKRSDKVEVRF
jgi:hypothetical protein